MRSPILISILVAALSAFAACADLSDEAGAGSATDTVVLELVDASSAGFWSREAEPDASVAQGGPGVAFAPGRHHAEEARWAAEPHRDAELASERVPFQTAASRAASQTARPSDETLIARPTPGDPNHYGWNRFLPPLDACRAIARREDVGSHVQPAACTVELATQHTPEAGSHDFTLVRADDSWWQSLMVVWTGGDGHTEARPIVNSWPDINGAEELAVARVEFIPGTTPRLAIELDQVGETFACDQPLGWTYEERVLVVCEKATGEALVCTTPIPVDVVEREHRYSEEGDLVRTRTLRRFSLRVDYTEGGLRLRRGRGRVPTEWKPRLGRRTLSQLAAGVDWR